MITLGSMAFFCDFQYVFKFPMSAADLLTFVADKFAVALDISEAFNFSKKTGKKKDWFAVQRQTSTFRCHKYAWFYSQFNSQSDELTYRFPKQKQVV